MRGPRKRPQSAADAISSFLRDAGLANRVEQAGIIPEWATLVGPQIAHVSQPLSITLDGVLFVAVTTHAWMNELSMMEPDLLKALNERAGPSKIVRIHWRLMR